MTFEERLKLSAERIRKEIRSSMDTVTDDYMNGFATIEYEDGHVKEIDREQYKDLYSSYESGPMSDVLEFDEYLFYLFC